jgi:hypothetical protein
METLAPKAQTSTPVPTSVGDPAQLAGKQSAGVVKQR